MVQQSQQSDNPLLRRLNALARLMDNQFRIPGTKIRFGFDGIIGLVPGVGDLITLAISSYLISSAIKNGASGFVVARMAVNTGIDAIIGAIPVLGDIFDVAFKANIRNVRLPATAFWTKESIRAAPGKSLYPWSSGSWQCSPV